MELANFVGNGTNWLLICTGNRLVSAHVLPENTFSAIGGKKNSKSIFTYINSDDLREHNRVLTVHSSGATSFCWGFRVYDFFFQS